MTSPMIGEYCYSAPSTKISSSNQLFFHFHSNGYGTSTGFKLEYNAKSKNLGHFVSRAKKQDIQVGIFQSMPCGPCNFPTQKPSATVHSLPFSWSAVFTILFLRNQKKFGQIRTLLYLLSSMQIKPRLLSKMNQTKVLQLLTKSFKNDLIFLFVFYLIVRFMKASMNFGKINLSKMSEPTSVRIKLNLSLKIDSQK